MPIELASRRGFQPRYPEPNINTADAFGNEAGSLVCGGAIETVQLGNSNVTEHYLFTAKTGGLYAWDRLSTSASTDRSRAPSR